MHSKRTKMLKNSTLWSGGWSFDSFCISGCIRLLLDNNPLTNAQYRFREHHIDSTTRTTQSNLNRSIVLIPMNFRLTTFDFSCISGISSQFQPMTCEGTEGVCWANIFETCSPFCSDVYHVYHFSSLLELDALPLGTLFSIITTITVKIDVCLAFRLW